MRKVRKDIMSKLMHGLAEKALRHPGARYYEYDTPRAKHFVRFTGKEYMFNSVYFDGQRCHSVEEVNA